MHIETTQSKRFIILLSLVLLFVTAINCIKLIELGNGLCETSDPYSESNSIRGCSYLVNEGFFTSYGLSDIAYGDAFPYFGVKGENCKSPYIYTHYPPGPDWILYGGYKLFNFRNLAEMRLIPMFLSIISLGILGYAVGKAYGAHVAIPLLLAICIVPTYINMSLGLHYQGNAFSLLLIMSACLLSLFSRSEFNARQAAILFVLGFFQGWLSFDYFFLVALLPIPFMLLHGHSHLKMLRDSKWVVIVLASPAAGFIVAEALHFMQNSLYFGSIGKAYTDLFGAAVHRGTATVSRIELLAWYVSQLIHDKKYFESYIFYSLIILAGAGISAIAVNKIIKGSESIRLKNEVLAVIAAFAVSSLWILAMPQHARVHKHFLPRHYYLFYIFVVLASLSITAKVVSRIVNRNSNQELINSANAHSDQSTQ